MKLEKENHLKLHAGRLLGVLCLLIPSQASSSYIRTVPIQDELEPAMTENVAHDLKEKLQRNIIYTQYSSENNLHYSDIPNYVFDKVLRDSEKRVDPEFKIYPVLKDSVEFWMKIYTQFSTRQVVLYDANHLNLIYDAVDLRQIVETAKTPILAEIYSNRAVESALKKYKQAFQSLAKNPHPKYPTHEEKTVLKSLKTMAHPPTFIELSKNIKSIRGQSMTHKGLLESQIYLNKMEEIFIKIGIPKELVALCLVESSFNLRAYSKVGAAGVWQFMPASSKGVLVIDPTLNIDERLSPLKATIAAGKPQALKWNYHYLGAWPLAIISYNHGHGGLPKFRNKKYNFNKIEYLFNPKKTKLGWASRNYYSEFLALVYATAYRSLFFGETPYVQLKPVQFTMLTKNETGLAFALEHAASLKSFMHLMLMSEM